MIKEFIYAMRKKIIFVVIALLSNKSWKIDFVNT